MANLYEINELRKQTELLQAQLDKQASHIRRLEMILEMRRIHCNSEHVWKLFPEFNCVMCVHCNNIRSLPKT